MELLNSAKDSMSASSTPKERKSSFTFRPGESISAEEQAKIEAAQSRGRRMSAGSYLLSKARAREAFEMLDREGHGYLNKEDV
jgi:hypothetical protein